MSAVPDIPDLLPASASPMERAASKTMGRFAPAMIVPSLWNSSTCPESVLSHLAWALSIEQWDHTWPAQLKRDTIAAARLIQMHKGTPWAIITAMAIMGQPDAEVIERVDFFHHDGSTTRNGYRHRRGAAGWATYRVVLNRPITTDQAAAIHALLETVKRNCIHLTGLDYSKVALRHNGAHVRDGQYVRGVI